MWSLGRSTGLFGLGPEKKTIQTDEEVAWKYSPQEREGEDKKRGRNNVYKKKVREREQGLAGGRKSLEKRLYFSIKGKRERSLSKGLEANAPE